MNAGYARKQVWVWSLRWLVGGGGWRCRLAPCTLGADAAVLPCRGPLGDRRTHEGPAIALSPAPPPPRPRCAAQHDEDHVGCGHGEWPYLKAAFVREWQLGVFAHRKVRRPGAGPRRRSAPPTMAPHTSQSRRRAAGLVAAPCLRLSVPSLSPAPWVVHLGCAPCVCFSRAWASAAHPPKTCAPPPPPHAPRPLSQACDEYVLLTGLGEGSAAAPDGRPVELLQTDTDLKAAVPLLPDDEANFITGLALDYSSAVGKAGMGLGGGMSGFGPHEALQREERRCGPRPATAIAARRPP